jgi:hypothetical protein
MFYLVRYSMDVLGYSAFVSKNLYSLGVFAFLTPWTENDGKGRRQSGPIPDSML